MAGSVIAQQPQGADAWRLSPAGLLRTPGWWTNGQTANAFGPAELLEIRIATSDKIPLAAVLVSQA